MQMWEQKLMASRVLEHELNAPMTATPPRRMPHVSRTQANRPSYIAPRGPPMGGMHNLYQTDGASDERRRVRQLDGLDDDDEDDEDASDGDEDDLDDLVRSCCLCSVCSSMRCRTFPCLQRPYRRLDRSLLKLNNNTNNSGRDLSTSTARRASRKNSGQIWTTRRKWTRTWQIRRRPTISSASTKRYFARV